MWVKNIGGIDETTMQISTGVTALVGENATNRTSLIQAIAAGLGTDSYTLKSDAECGEVSLTVGEETYLRRMRRENNHLETDGDPYLDDPEVAELFAVLLDSNEVRQAVRQQGDIRELILQPVDTEAIDRQISELVDRRRELDRELDRLESLADDLTDLKAKRSRTEDELERIESELAATREQRATLDDGSEEDESSPDAQLDEELEQLSEVKNELERVEANLDSERKRLASLRENRETVEQQFNALEPPDETQIAALKERLENLRTRKRCLSSTIAELQQVIRFNSDRLADSRSGLGDALDGEDDDESITDQLNPADAAVTCWTCGSEVERQRIEEMAEKLDQLRSTKTEEKNEVASEIESVSAEIDALQARKEEYAELDDRLAALETKIEESEATVDDLEQRRDALTQEIEEREATIDELQRSQAEEALTVQQEISELEYKKGRVENELDTLTAQIEEAEAALAEQEALEQERAAIAEDIAELRTRIDRIETQAVEEFNTHMDELIDHLGYENIDRIWIESTEREVTDGRQETTERRFELHIIRQSGDGEVYEDTIDHLSESEREIVGLVVALAGYLVHNVHETVPFMLLDSIEMIDGERLVDLISYLEEYIPYLVVVLLPDHAKVFEEQLSSDETELIEV
jgi:chromosome segregation ATPase